MTTTEERIAWLEQELRVTTGELVQANDRIEQLEAALREIVDFPNIGEICCAACSLIASAALAGHQTRSTGSSTSHD